jgi:hypothetical protein
VLHNCDMMKNGNGGEGALGVINIMLNNSIAFFSFGSSFREALAIAVI